MHKNYYRLKAFIFSLGVNDNTAAVQLLILFLFSPLLSPPPSFSPPPLSAVNV